MTTTNPVPSNDPTDLLFNAQKLDQVVNGSAQYYTDRLGVNRRTVEGISAAADVVLGGLGYAPPVAYAAGISLTLTTQTVEYAGEVYAPKVASLPFQTSTWATDSAKFRLIQGVAATDLAASGGSAMIGYMPAGTGAVATTVQEKLRDSVSVLDFYANGVSGAKVDPTGVIDSTLGIKAAQTFCGKTKELTWPAGSYKITQQLIQEGFWRARGKVILKFSGLSASTDCLLISGGNTYGQTITDGFIVDCQTTGRDGVVLLNGNDPIVRVQVINAQRDGFAVFCGGWDWVENADMSIYTAANGRHGCRIEVWGSGGSFFNESVLKLEVRGVSQRYNDGYGIWGYCPSTAPGAKISALHISSINLDAQRGTANAAGFEPGQNPIRLAYATGGANSFEAWSIDGGGFETTNGLNDFRSPYLIYAENGVTANHWDVRGIVPYNWSTGDGIYGLTDYKFHSCKDAGGTFVSNVIGGSAVFPAASASSSVNIDIPIPEFPSAANYGATLSSIIYDLTLSYQKYSGGGQEMQVMRVEISYNKTGAAANWVSSLVVASNVGTLITAVNSLSINGNNLRVTLTTGAGFGSGGGDNHIHACLTRMSVVRV